MSKFLYLADSHCGANPQLYQKQRAYTERLPEIVCALKECVAVENIDFVLHGGDLIDATSDHAIQAATKLFRFEVPMLLCLGNHDLTTPDALQKWLLLAPQLFPNGRPEYSVTTDDCVIHVIPNHWCDAPYYWKEEQRPHFRPQQMAFLESALADDTGRPHILLTHAPTFGLPPQQTGLSAPLHASAPEYAPLMMELVSRYPHLRCVLGAHSHLNMCVRCDDTYFITTSALVETPFECKIFEVAPGRIAMRTVTLGSWMPSGLGAYDFDKTFVQGRAVDRAFERTY